ncbi:hypothetical protein [Actinomadura madurae]|uniref:hypothetical protein n=1 Tax=Actinomadura madurae TaxID=1993 RepID=UPI0020D21DE6|nr:hypothetical protein [Actinomadura madurae]MCQ0014054.1 hypothetical protein [Actinomadura madurae]
MKVGLVAGGLGAYWPQFPDLLPQLKRSAERVSERMRGLGAEVVDVGFISDAQEGAAAAERLRAAGCDIIVGFLTTYMTATMLVPVAQRADAPVLLINLQPTESMDHATFDTGQWLAYCGACPLPEMANAFARCGVPFRSVSGYLEDERAWAKIGRWVRAAGVRAALRRGRHGLMGHLYPGMLDVSTDLTLVSANFGGHVEVLEFDDLRVRVEKVTDAETAAKKAEAEKIFELDASVDDDDLTWAARVAVGLDRLAEDFELDSLAYYHRGLDGEVHERLGAGMILGASLLTARGIPAARRVRAAHVPRHADRRPARRGRLVHRAAGPRLPPRPRRDGPRRARAPGDQRPPPAAAGARRLPRQARLRRVRRVRRQARPGHRVRDHPAPRRPVRVRRVRGRDRGRPAAADRQHHVPRRLRLRPRRVDRRLVRHRHLAPLGARHRPPDRRPEGPGRPPGDRAHRGEAVSFSAVNDRACS